VRIGHNGKGLGAGWHCDHVEVYRDTDPDHVWYFPCGNWFDKGEPPNQIVQTLPVAVRDVNAAVAEYKITVYTSDIKCVRGRTLSTRPLPRVSRGMVIHIRFSHRSSCGLRERPDPSTLSGWDLSLHVRLFRKCERRDASIRREKSQALKCSQRSSDFRISRACNPAAPPRAAFSFDTAQGHRTLSLNKVEG
jgi:hypothetical protein